MSIERERFFGEKSGENELQVGTGDPIIVSSLKKIVDREKGFRGVEPVEEQVPVDALQRVQESLARLPFRIGEKEHLATFPRTAHEAAVIISPRSVSHLAPESEWQKRALVLRFEKGLEANLSFDNVKNLTFEQRETSGLGKVNVIHFETDEVFDIGGEQVGEVRLVVPTEESKR